MMLDGTQLVLSERLGNAFPMFSPGLREALVTRGTLLRFHDGDPLMRSGQYVRSTMLLLAGSAKLYREGADGGEHYLYSLESGSACALSLICATQRRTSMIKGLADGEVEALAVPVDAMEVLMRDHPEWYQFVVETYRVRMEELLEVIDQVAFRSLDERLILYLTKRFDSQGPELHATHQEIATDLNSSREVISRLLKRMEKEGMVELQRNAVLRRDWKKAQALR